MRICPFCNAGINSSDTWYCSRCGKEPEHKGGITFLSPKADQVNFPQEGFTPLSEIENGHFWFESRNRLIISMFKKYVKSFSRYLEIGCGTGFVLREVARTFPQASVYGAEFYQAGLEIAAKRTPRAKFFQMDANSIPFCEEFDTIGAFDVLEHIDDDQHVLNEMAKALKPGGYLLITVPQHSWLWSSSDTMAGHVRRYSRRELLQKIHLSRLRTLRITSFVSLLLPFMYALRKKSGNPGTTLRLGPLNTLFSATMTLERWLLKTGISLPAGGSLFLLAKKAQ